MKREFLDGLGLDREIVDKILTENGNDIEREKAKTLQAKADLADLQQKLTDAQTELAKAKETSGNAEETRKQLEELQGKYDTNTKALQEKITKRERMDAAEAFIAEHNLKFSSKSARSAFLTGLLGKEYEVKDGKFDCDDSYIKEQQAADPEAFASDKPQIKFAANVGVGSAPEPQKSRAAILAEQHHKELYGKKE